MFSVKCVFEQSVEDPEIMPTVIARHVHAARHMQDKQRQNKLIINTCKC